MLFVSFNKRHRVVSEGLVNLTGDHTGHELRSASTRCYHYSMPPPHLSGWKITQTIPAVIYDAGVMVLAILVSDRSKEL